MVRYSHHPPILWPGLACPHPVQKGAAPADGVLCPTPTRPPLQCVHALHLPQPPPEELLERSHVADILGQEGFIQAIIVVAVMEVLEQCGLKGGLCLVSASHPMSCRGSATARSAWLLDSPSPVVSGQSARENHLTLSFDGPDGELNVQKICGLSSMLCSPAPLPPALSYTPAFFVEHLTLDGGSKMCQTITC